MATHDVGQSELRKLRLMISSNHDQEAAYQFDSNRYSSDRSIPAREQANNGDPEPCANHAPPSSDIQNVPSFPDQPFLLDKDESNGIPPPTQQQREYIHTSSPIAITSNPSIHRASQNSEPEQQQPQPQHQRRRRGIKISPEVTVNDGHRQEMGQPVSKISSSNRPRGRSIMHELFESESRRRSQSETISSSNEHERSSSRDAHKSDRDKQGTHQGEAKHPLLQATVNERAQNRQVSEEDRVAALTSGSTARPAEAAKEAAQYVDGNSTLLPRPVRSPMRLTPAPLESQSISPRTRAPPSRSYSYNLDRTTSSLRESRRLSIMSSGAKSPASNYLSQWKRDSNGGSVEPDGKGQTFGDNNEYVIGRQVGYGGFSVIKEAHTFESNEPVLRAVKILRRHFPGRSEDENECLRREFEHEISVWRLLKHPHILQLLADFTTSFAIFCVIPLNKGGTLRDIYDRSIIQRSRKTSTVSNRSLARSPDIRDSDSSLWSDHLLPLAIAKRYLFQLALAIKYLHSEMRIVHRDIKLENCLIDDSNTDRDEHGTGKLLLCDFGMADFLPSSERDPYQPNPLHEQWGFNSEETVPRIGPAKTSTSIAGSADYASPELINSGRPIHEPSIDIWAYGVLAYAVLVSEMPFRHKNGLRQATATVILNGEWDHNKLTDAIGQRQAASGSDHAKAAAELAAGCMCKDVSSRWDICGILECGFLRECQPVPALDARL
ncbi:MAG: hypothetical protein M1831_004320 [Alyxoria varia]|nr:MAG: hypothetical protein M1831_004320 [Alyxoria varia]